MHKSNYIIIGLLIAILGLGLFLRHNNFRTIPRHGATFDEFAWTWLGVNLIQKGEPVSWSPHGQYKERTHLIYQGAAFFIVRPYLEHPPLFGLVSGGFTLLNGARDMYDVTLDKMRPLALVLGVFSIFMLFLLTWELYGKTVAIIASLLYATIPTVVIGSRIVQNENFLIPFWLLSLFLVVRYLKTGKKRLRNTAAVIAGLLSLAKVPWLVVGLSLSMILSYKGKWRDAVFVSLITVIIFSLFILYGLYFDKDLFFSLWGLQLNRYDISFSGFFSIFTTPLLIDRYYLDGWILFGWLAMTLLAKDIKKHAAVIIPFTAYLVLYIFAIPNEPAHGWYRYPFIPFLIIATAHFVKDEFSKVSLASLFFILMVGLALFSNTWERTFGFSYVVYRLFIVAVGASIFLPLWFTKLAKFSKLLLMIWTGLLILFNVFAVLVYIE